MTIMEINTRIHLRKSFRNLEIKIQSALLNYSKMENVKIFKA